MRSIDGNLERQNVSREQMSNMVSQLPVAMDSFRKLSNSQEEITSILTLVNSHMENSNEKDRHLMENLDRFGQVVGEVNQTNSTSLAALEKFQDRLELSDNSFQNLFESSQKSNDALGGVLSRLEKKLFLSNAILAIVTVLLLLGGISFVLSSQKNGSSPPEFAGPEPSEPVVPNVKAPPEEPPSYLSLIHI